MADVQNMITTALAQASEVAVADIHLEHDLSRFGLDSVRMLELLMVVEDEYDIDIDDADPDLIGIGTVGELVAYVERAVKARA